MTRKRDGDAPQRPRRGQPSGGEVSGEYEATLLLERLESLIEEMDELGVMTRDEIEVRARELRERLGD